MKSHILITIELSDYMIRFTVVIWQHPWNTILRSTPYCVQHHTALLSVFRSRRYHECW